MVRTLRLYKRVPPCRRLREIDATCWKETKDKKNKQKTPYWVSSLASCFSSSIAVSCKTLHVWISQATKDLKSNSSAPSAVNSPTITKSSAGSSKKGIVFSKIASAPTELFPPAANSNPSSALLTLGRRVKD